MITGKEKILFAETEPSHPLTNENLNKWFSLQKKYLNNNIYAEVDFSLKLKDAAKFYRFSLPPDINELFVRIEEAPVYWLGETKLNHYLHDFFRIHYPPVSGTDQVKYIEDYYSKWLMIKHKEEKKYFASTAINFIDRSGIRNNFYSFILCGVIFTYEQKLSSYQKGIEHFNKAKEIIYSIKLEEQTRDELDYLISLFSGFAAIINNEHESAKNFLLAALTTKPNGITAKFHLAIIEAKQNCLQSAEYLVEEILQSDMNRISYAAENFNLPMFNYFINNSIISNIFYYEDFARISDYLENRLLLIEESNIDILNGLKGKTETFRQLSRENNFSENIVGKVFFIEKLIDNPIRNKNPLFLNIAEKLDNQFNSHIILIINSIKEKYYAEIDKKLLYFDIEIGQKYDFIKNLSQHFETSNIENHKRLEKEIKVFQDQITAEINLWEERINTLDTESKLNPKSAFNKTMTYNVILSFLSSLMGGCAGYSSSSVKDIMELKHLFSAIITSGVKWGLITFAVGFIISAVAAAYALAEKSNIKQGILQKISSLKNEKERGITAMKKESERKEKIMTQNYNDRLKEQKELTQELLSEKENRKNILLAEADPIIAGQVKPLEALIQ